MPYLPQISVRADHPKIKLFREQVMDGAPALTVAAGTGPRSQCYSNVRQQVALVGGRAECCWLFSEWPGHFVEAMHHAVWRSPDGKLVDLTEPSYPTMSETTAIVLTGQKLGSNDPLDGPLFLRLDDNPATMAYIQIFGELRELRRSLFAKSIARSANIAEVKRMSGEIEQLGNLLFHIRNQLLRGDFSLPPGFRLG